MSKQNIENEDVEKIYIHIYLCMYIYKARKSQEQTESCQENSLANFCEG